MLWVQLVILYALCWGHCASAHFITKLRGQRGSSNHQQQQQQQQQPNFSAIKPDAKELNINGTNELAAPSKASLFKFIFHEEWLNISLVPDPNKLNRKVEFKQRQKREHFINRKPVRKSKQLARHRRQMQTLKTKDERLSVLNESVNEKRSILDFLTTKAPSTVPLKKHPSILEDNDSPIVFLPIQKIFADVGIGFQKYLSPDIFRDKKEGNARSLNIELLTVDGNQLFDTSWIKFDQSNLKLYGFPLKGNQEQHVFILKATNRNGRSAFQNINVVVYAPKPIFNHYINICTTMTLSDYGGHVEKRLRLAKGIGNYVFPEIRTNDVWIWKFEEGCIFLTFRHLPSSGKCDLEAIRKIEQKLQLKGDVRPSFQQALKSVTQIVSVNITLLNECKMKNNTGTDDGLGWLRDIAPVFILIAVVAVPTLISCIVCREVRRRQAMMRQLQDKRMKEDREQMLLQAAEYKHECGFDSESENGDRRSFRPCRQQEDEGKRFFGFSRIADIIIPEVVIDTVKQGTEILNTFLPQEACENAANDALVAAQRRLSVVQTLHPMHKLLDMSQEEQAQQLLSVKADNEFQKRLKNLLKFLRNPLDISPVVNDLENEQDINNEQEKARKLSRATKIQINTLLPSISSIFKVNENEGRKISLKEVTENMSVTIREKLEEIWKKDSKATCQTAEMNNVGKGAEQTLSRENNGRRFERLHQRSHENHFAEFNNDPRGNTAERARTNSAIYFDQGTVPGLMPCFGARFRMVDKQHDRRLSLQPIDGSISKENGFISRVMQKGKCAFGVKQQGMENSNSKKNEVRLNQRGLVWQDIERDFEDSDPTKFDFETQLTEYQRNIMNKNIPFELANLSRDEAGECHKWDYNYAEFCNPKKQQYCASKEGDAQNMETQFNEEFFRESNFPPTAVWDQAMLENSDHCYVNMGQKQVQERSSMIARTDEDLTELTCCSRRQNANEKQTLEIVLPNSCDFSSGNNYKESKRCSRTNEDASKGLLHYDPASGTWYPAYSSLKNILPESKMFSLLENFKRSDSDRATRKKASQVDNTFQRNLCWHNLETKEDNKDCRKWEREKSRRKTGIDISAGFRESVSNPQSVFDLLEGGNYESVQSKLNDENSNSAMDTTTCRSPGRGIWTEKQNNYDDGDDFYESSDDELDQRNFFNQYRDGENYSYFQQDLYNMQYGEDDGFSHDICSGEIHYENSEILYDQNNIQESSSWLKSEMNQHSGFEFDENKTLCEEAYQTNEYGWRTKEVGMGELDYDEDEPRVFEGRRRSLTDSEVQLSTSDFKPLDSPTKSEPDASEKKEYSSIMQKERRKSFLERQRRVEIPEKLSQQGGQKDGAKIHVNPIFVIEERNSKDETEEHCDVQENFDAITVKRMQDARRHALNGGVRTRKLTYNGPFPTANVEAEKIRKQDADIIEHQTKGFLERRRQSLQHITGSYQQGKTTVESEPITIQNRMKREDVPKRVGMRRFSTPSMDSWTSTPEKYYYDATGDNSISEEDVDCASLRKDKEKQSFVGGRGRAREYTQRLLDGVSPKIRRHSTSIMGQKSSIREQSGNATSGTFLGKIGERKFVQTIQTKLGKKESKSEEPKSPIFKDREKYMDDEKAAKGSPLTAIRNTLFLFSGGK